MQNRDFAVTYSQRLNTAAVATTEEDKDNYDDPPTATEAEKLGICHIFSPPRVGLWVT